MNTRVWLSYTRKSVIERDNEEDEERFISWTRRPDVRALAPEINQFFYWVVCRGGADFTQGKASSFSSAVDDMSVIMLCCGDNAGLAIAFSSADEAMATDRGEWRLHLTNDGWTTYLVESAAEAREAVMRYTKTKLPPL